MATINTTAPRDLSTLASFKAWAQVISNAFSTFTWIQSNDTGQVVWTATVLTLTQVAVSGGSAVYSYSSFTGPTPRVGMSVAFSGFATGGNNVTATLTAVSGGASGTVTVTATTQVNETHAGSGTTTALAAAPGANVYVNEIWKSNDAFTTYYVKVEYGNNNSGNGPSMKVSIGTGTNGSGTLSGIFTSPGSSTGLFPNQSITQSGAANLFNCYLSGDGSRFSALMWRDDTNSQGPILFAVQRSMDATGAYTSEYVTLLTAGECSSNANWYQQSIIFGLSVGNAVTSSGTGGQPIILKNTANDTDILNSNAPLSPVFPDVGYFGKPMDIVLIGPNGAITEGSIITVSAANMPYGVSHTYIATKSQALSSYQTSFGRITTLMRYD